MNHSRIGRIDVDGATVSVHQSVERTVAKSGGQDAPKTNDKEDHFDVNRSQEIKDDNP